MSKKSHKALASATVMSLILTSTLTATVSAATGVERLYGSNRETTAIDVATKVFEKAETVVLVNGYKSADALSATPLAKALNAPILSVNTVDVPSAALTKALSDLGAKKVVVVGGEGAVTKALAEKLAETYAVERISGANRYETNVNVAKKVMELKDSKEAFVVNGSDASYADALSIASIAASKGAPIVFTNGKTVSEEAKAIVKDLKVAAIGGTGVVSAEVLEAVNATRVGGADRFATNLEVLKAYKDVIKLDNVFVAYGLNFADALVASAAAAKTNAPVVLADKTNTAFTKGATDYIEANKDAIKNVYLVGGTGVIADSVKNVIDTIVNPVVTELAVESVNAVNAAQLVVKFNAAVKADAVITEGATSSDPDTLKAGAISIVGLDRVAPDAADLEAELSKDGKTLTLTLLEAKALKNFEGRYDVKIAKDAILSTEGKGIEKFETTISVKDRSNPTVVGTTKVDASTTKVNFSEPIVSLGNITYKQADGTSVDPAAENTKINATLDGSSIKFEIIGSKLVNKDITVSFVGTADYAGNLVSPNPSTAVIKKADKDGTAPTVKSVAFANEKTVVVEFSEEVYGVTASTLTVNTASATAVSQDSTNKAKYKFTLGTSATDIVNVVVNNSGIKDLSGEAMENNYSTRIEVKADKTAPVVSAATVTRDAIDNAEYLTLTFSEDVDLIASGTITLAAKQYKDYVTKSVSLTFDATNLVKVTDKNDQYKVKLANIKSNGSDLVENAQYTVDLVANLVEDVAANKNAAKTSAFTFTRGKDGTTTNSGFQTVEAITVTDNNKLTVKFGKEVDGASATNKANYSVNGAVVDKVELQEDKSTVVVYLVKDSVTFTGTRYISINNVKTSANIGLEKEYRTTISMNENVRPTIVSAKATDKNVITITFSEAVTNGVNKDFIVSFNGSEEGAVDVVVDSSDAKKVTITTSSDITSAALSAGITIKTADTIDVKDTAGNGVNASSAVTVTLN